MATDNTNLTFKGNRLVVRGAPIKVGALLPDFRLVGLDMSDITKQSFTGKKLIISVVPSVDTPTCSIQTKRFNDAISTLSSEVVVITVSRDLPFAQKRWCGAENSSNIAMASDYKYRSFGEIFGVEIPDMGLLARAVFVADTNGIITHVEYVSELSQEPDYANALSHVK